MSAAFPPRSLGAPSSRLIARQENSAAALRSLAGSAGGERIFVLTLHAQLLLDAFLFALMTLACLCPQ
jgi:hypothetical protein